MDSSIRTLLSTAQSIAGPENPPLHQAFGILKNVAENKPSIDTPEAFGQDLYVLCAELAFQNGLMEMSKDCLKMFFMKPPPGNQFLCRAYLCQAQLLAPQDANNPEQLEKAVVYLLKAISFAKKNPRYHFLVYNASVIYWQMCRPFLKTNYKQYLARSLHQVVKALDDIDDQDFEWRAQLMIALMECHLDANKRTDASSIAGPAATFIKNNVPHLYKKVFGIIVRNQLLDSSKLHKDIKNSPELSIYYKILKLKVSLDQGEQREYYSEIQRILNQIGIMHSGIEETSSAKTDGGKKKATKGRQASPSSAKGEENDKSRPGSRASDKSEKPELTRKSSQSRLDISDEIPHEPEDINTQTPNENIQQKEFEPCIESETESTDSLRSASKAGGRRTPTPTSNKKLAEDSQDKPFLLLELARLCLELDYADLAQDCVDHMKTCVVRDQGFYLELELLQCELMVKSLGEKQESYQRNVIDVRLQALKRCEETIMNAIRLRDPNVIQAACVTQWNLCLPLLQPNLRHYVRKPLTLVAQALEDIQSLLIPLRCQVHTELAKCEEDQEQIQVGMENLTKALALDDSNIYRERLEVALKRLELRSQLYKQPERAEDQAAMIIEQALALDDSNIYRERLEVALKRLELRSQLYKQPERAEDQAAMIIEQARKADSGTMRMKRSLLVKAGEALAPDAFLLVLDSESDTKDVSGGKAPLTQIKKLANKARQFNKCVQKAEGHLKRLGDENDRERARLWGDLAKTARKQEVWDVCRVAARFCLLYDDGRWKNVIPEKKMESPKPGERRKEGGAASSMGSAPERAGNESSMKVVQESVMSTMPKESVMTTVAEGSSYADTDGKKLPGRPPSRPSSPDKFVPLYDKDLIRMLAEVQFIQGEADVHLLRSEGIELNDMPIPPVDKSKRPKGYVAKKPEEDPDWIEYCDWIKSLTNDATSSFLRGLELGIELVEPWLVCSAASYIWNYNNHVLTQLRHREIIATLATVVEGLKKVGHAGETVMLVNICNALAYSYMKPWIPAPKGKDEEAVPTPVISPDPGKKGKASPSKQPKPATNQVVIDPESAGDLKKAIEVCEYAIDVTNGYNSSDVVPIGVRTILLQTWVHARQMAQQQVPKTLGADDDSYADGQRQMSRAIVALEMISVNRNGIMEFKDTPSILEVANWIEECSWSDKFMELQMWTRLTYLSFLHKQHALVLRCSKKALHFAVVGTQPKSRKMEVHRYMVEQEMLSYASALQGQSLVENMAGKNAIRREALEAFLNSARYAANAENYEMVMTAARHYWNTCVPLVSQPIERELLREPIKAILSCITETAEIAKKTEEKEEESEEDSDAEEGGGGGGGEGGEGGKPPADDKEASASGAVIGSPEDDLTLRASLYGVLFQSYADKKQYEEGLQAMDQAIADMPRTKHRLLIFKHRVMTKAKLGKSINMDIQKFKDESEDYVAHMWRRVALNSKETLEQLISYQAAVEALSSVSNEWQKVDLLLEFGQWLYYNEFPLQDCVDQVEWAIDIMLNMRTETDIQKERVRYRSGSSSSGKRSSGKRKSSASSPTKKDKKGKTKGSAKPKPAPTPVPKPSQARAETPRKSPDPKKSARSVDTRSDASSDTDEINPEGYIPVAKQAIIGVLPNNPGLKMQDLEDPRQLDGLLRAYILLAEIGGRSSPEYKDFLIMAHKILMRLWQVSVPQTGAIIKEIAKAQAAAAAGDGKSEKDSQKNKKDKKETSAPPVKERPKRKGPLDYLPSTTEEWAIYDVPDEVIEAFNHESMKVTGINHHTIVKPMLTMYYLDAMTTMMRDVGYSHLVLPVLALQELMSRDLLKNSALNVVVHGRAIEICTELNIKHGIKFHETLCGPIVLKEEDQAKSRDEIAVLKEKALQVIKEEQRVKESLAKLAEESAKRKSKSLTSRTAASMNTDKGEEKPIESHLGKVLGAVTFRDVWTDTAELLIKQTDYQGARVFLNEAFIAAQAFEDIALEARILMLFGKLSYREAQYGQAFNFCREAQSIHQGDEMFWYETTMIMADSTLMDYENRNAKRIARGILVHGINEFMRIGDERPNRGCVMQYILSTMEAKLAGIQASIIFEENPDINIPKVLTRLIAVCDRYESATEKMIRVGYFREVLPVMKDHASVLMKMAKQSVEAEKEIRHTYYLQAMKVIKEAVAISELVVRDVQTLTSLPEVRNLSLPVQRELADIKIKCGELLLEIFKEHSKEDRERQLEDLRKGTVVKMVEDYIRETPKYTHMEREWVETTTTVIEDAMLKFVDAHNLSVGIPRLRTEALCGLGRCLRAFSIFSSPNSPTQWIVNEEEMSKLSDDAGEGEEEGEEKAEFDEASKQFIRCTEQIKEIKALEDTSNHYLLQASEVLTQALNLALHHHFRDLAGVVSLELLECNGQYDPQFSSMFLALYQSCTTSLKAECLLKEAQLDPYTSQLAALLHQRDDILRSDLYTNMSAGSLLSAVNTSLSSWQAWKRLEVQPTHLDLLKEFPPNFNFIILQHSPDKNFLYGAILDKPKNVSGGGKNVKQNVPPATSRAKVFGVPVSPDVLDFLLERYADYKQATQQLLLKLEYQRAQVMMRQKMLENLDESLKQKTSHHHLDEEDAAEEAHLIAEFESVIKDMESYLGPITAQLQGILIPQTVTPASGKEAKNAPAEPPPSIEAAILLADQDLMQLPLEALGFLQVENVVSLSRDFSLQMFYHRYYREEVPAAKTEESAADKKKKAKTSQDNPMSRIPGLRDASKKNAKIVPLSRELQPWQQGVDTMNFRYIVDSNVDCAETEIHKPKEVFEKLMEEYENQFTPRWLGVFGTDHAPSVGEWEIYLTENSSFIFYGMERFLSFIPPSKLTALNIPDCNIVYILDLAQTSKSFTRQSKLDVLKSANILALEKPVETAMLLSLTGVKCVMANQWHCTLQENAEKLQATMKDILDGGKTTGEAIRLLFTPYRRKKPEPEGEETAEGTESAKPPEEAKATPDPGEDGEKSVQESTQEDQEPEPERSWYNLVLYGLPNLIVTQLS